jgi:hypothetical protein
MKPALRVEAKPELVQSQSPAVQVAAHRSIPEAMTLNNASLLSGCGMMLECDILAEALFSERPVSNRFKGMSGTPKRTRRSTVVNAGSPTRGDPYGDGAAIVAEYPGQRLGHDEGRQRVL